MDNIQLKTKSLLHKYKYRNNKEYYKCSIKFITDANKKCIKIIKDEYHCDNR